MFNHSKSWQDIQWSGGGVVVLWGRTWQACLWWMEGLQKRLADMAVKPRQAIIQSAEDFYKWGKDQENSKLKYIFVSHEECVDVQEDLDISL